MTSRTLIRGGNVVTMDGERRQIDGGDVLIENDLIVQIGTGLESDSGAAGATVIDAAGKAVIPGLVNAHMHSQNGLIRATADDALGPRWLNTFINPMHRVITPEDAYTGALLSYGEMIKSGTTAGLDMGRHMHRCADAAEELGIRMIVSPYVTDLPPFDYFETFEDNDRLVEDRHNSAGGRVKVWYGIELLPYSTPDLYRRAREGATKHGVGINLHANCEAGEVAYSIDRYGKPPIDLFNDWEILGPDVVVGHGVVLTDREIELLAAHGTSVIHCPQTGMKVALGIAPVPELRRAGVTVGLGTDGTAENGNLDMVETLKYAALLQKLNKMDPTVLPAYEVLELATIGGAKALGLDEEIGSIEVGKKADVVVIDRSAIRMTPIHLGEYDNTVTSIVYSARSDDVSTVIIDGQLVLADRKLTRKSEEEIVECATRVGREMIARREQWVQSRDRELDKVF